MTKFFATVMALFFIIEIVLWTLILMFGGAELLWWIFTGDFFHFVVESASASVW